VIQICPRSKPILRSRYGFQQLPWLDPERMGQLHDVQQSDIAFAALQAADGVAVEVRQLGEPFLREPAFVPQFAAASAG
jgi:hypothetical protein